MIMVIARPLKPPLEIVSWHLCASAAKGTLGTKRGGRIVRVLA